MADIKKVNVGGLDYNVKDDTARTNATTALSHEAYVENGNTASQAYSIIGTPINWKGTLCHTKTAVAKGATWAIGTNLTAVANLGKMISSIKTYVGGDGKLHFVDGTGADTVLPFSGTGGTPGVKGTMIGSCMQQILSFNKQYTFTKPTIIFFAGATNDYSYVTFTIEGVYSWTIPTNDTPGATAYLVNPGTYTIKASTSAGLRSGYTLVAFAYYAELS